MKHSCVFIVLVFICFQAIAGGPWAEGKKKGYVEASSLFTIGSTVTDHTHQIYAEIGVLEKLSLKTIIPFKYISTPEDLGPDFIQGSLFGISNVLLGAKYEVFKKKAVMSVGLDVSFQTIKENDQLGMRSGFKKFTFIPIYSIGFGMEKFYTYAEIKPGFSTNGFGHEFGLVYELGGKVDENIWLGLYSELKVVYDNGSFNDTDVSTYQSLGSFIDGSDFFTVGGKFSAILVAGFGVNAAVFYGTSVSGSGGGAASVKVGLFYDW